VPDVVVGRPLGDAERIGSNRLGRFRGLDLRLLIHARHRVARRRQVQAHDVADLDL
jgi:hypothetical protein